MAKLPNMLYSIIAPALALLSVAQAQSPQRPLTNYGAFTARSGSEAAIIGSIHNVLALFNLALDTKNFDALRDVYTTDVVAKVAREPTNDLESLIKFYNGTTPGNVVTQHTSHTILVYDIKHLTAKSISYANAYYFSPLEEGKLFARDVNSVYERYDDSWVREPSGQWKIKERSINIYVS